MFRISSPHLSWWRAAEPKSMKMCAEKCHYANSPTSTHISESFHGLVFSRCQFRPCLDPYFCHFRDNVSIASAEEIELSWPHKYCLGLSVNDLWEASSNLSSKLGHELTAGIFICRHVATLAMNWHRILSGSATFPKMTTWKALSFHDQTWNSILLSSVVSSVIVSTCLTNLLRHSASHSESNFEILP